MIIHNNRTWIMKMLLVAGAVEILVGFLHFVMPNFALKSPGFNLLNGSEIDFISSGVYAVGILLVAFGSLTIAVSLVPDKRKGLLLPFLVIKSFLWSGRIGLELLFPVTIPIYHFHRPTTIIMPLLVFETLLFIVPMVYVWAKKGTLEGYLV